MRLLIEFFGSNMLVTLAVPRSSGFNLFVSFCKRVVIYFILSLLMQHLTVTAPTLTKLLVRMRYE